MGEKSRCMNKSNIYRDRETALKTAGEELHGADGLLQPTRRFKDTQGKKLFYWGGNLQSFM